MHSVINGVAGTKPVRSATTTRPTLGPGHAVGYDNDRHQWRHGRRAQANAFSSNNIASNAKAHSVTATPHLKQKHRVRLQNTASYSAPAVGWQTRLEGAAPSATPIRSGPSSSVRPQEYGVSGYPRGRLARHRKRLQERQLATIIPCRQQQQRVRVTNNVYGSAKLSNALGDNNKVGTSGGVVDTYSHANAVGSYNGRRQRSQRLLLRTPPIQEQRVRRQKYCIRLYDSAVGFGEKCYWRQQ